MPQRKVVALVAVLSLALIAGIGWATSQSGADRRSAPDRAWSVMPADVHAATLIDWRRIAENVPAANPDDPQGWRTAATQRDLIQWSVLVNHGEAIADALGWSPRDLRFEAYGQSDEGVLLVLGLAGSRGDALTWTAFSGRFGDLGYTETDGVWSAGEDFNARAPGVPEQLRHIAHVPELDLVLASDTGEYVHRSLDVVDGSVPSFTDRAEIGRVLDPLRSTTSASVSLAENACEDLSLDVLTAEERAAVRDAAPRPLVRYEALAFGVQDAGESQTLTAVLAFADESTAAGQLEARRALFTGDALGRTRRLGATVDASRAMTHGAASVFTFEVGDPTSRAFAELSRGRQPAVTCEIPRDSI